MATTSGRNDPSLEELLFKEPYRFNVFQAVRLLSLIAPDRARVGGDGPPRREVVRFHALASLAFPASEIAALKAAPIEGTPSDMTIAFLGLIGPTGVLPYPYTELLIERIRDGDRTAVAFLDIFNHRMTALFVRAWEKYRPALVREWGGPDPLAHALFAFMGLATPGLKNRHEFPDDALLFHAAAFSQRRRPAVVLEQLLADYFGEAVEVLQFSGRWLKLGPDDRSVVAAEPRNNGLGTSLMLGARSWDERGKFRLRIGPLTYQRFLAFSPDGRDFRALCQMTRLYIDGGLEFDVQLVLKAVEVPNCLLSAAAGAGSRIGRNAWVKARPATADAVEAVFAEAR